MRSVLFVVVLGLSAWAVAASAADIVPPEGFTAIFDGKDFTGWQAARGGKPESDEARAKWQEHWKVEGGVIKFDGQGPDLWTSTKYKDFVLLVDWRLPRPGDSGIYLRGQGKSQVNIWCSPLGSGEVWGYRTDKSQPEETPTPTRSRNLMAGTAAGTP